MDVVMTIQKIREDILNLRGAEVVIFGQPTTLPSEVDEQYIDILDVLDVLEPYEVTHLVYDEYNEELDDYEVKEFESIDEYLDYLHDIGEIKEIAADNSYNWSSPVSNDFNYTIYEMQSTGEVLVEFKVHRYGDVRCNYTESALLKFDNDYQFAETLMEVNKIITVNGYEVHVDIFSDGMEVYTEDGEYVDTVYDLDELKGFTA